MTTPQDLAASNAHCRRLCRRSGSTFRFAFRVLPRDQRDAMHALYAYFRLSDDVGDDTTVSKEQRRNALKVWRLQLTDALAGRYSHPIHAALHEAVTKYGIPHRYLMEVLEGVESDLGSEAFSNESDLLRYCYQVSSAVGLACIRVWGLSPGTSWDEAEPLAIRAGYAFQLTNILRDLGEDAANGRCYLPADELKTFGVSPGDWHEPSRRENLRRLLQFQANRARGHYAACVELAELLQPPGRTMFRLMTRAYRGLLERVASAGCDGLNKRTRLGAGMKLNLLVRLLLNRA